MWHEARKQERKIRGMLVDYRRRAERRRDFYEKIKADPTQFMQLHGRSYKIHLDPNVAAAAESASTMMPWQGEADTMIDRFDARAHLDYIAPPNLHDVEKSSDERQCNYERYRVLVQNAFLGISEEKYLRQLHLEEQYGYTAELDAPKKKKAQGAAIGFNYDDADGSSHPQPTYKEGQKEESEESDADIDFDLAIDVSKIEMSQAHELNKYGQSFGMSGNDFYSYLTNDLEEAENLRAAREEEEERALYSGRRSRRARRAHQEKRLHNRVISPPSYAAKEPDKQIERRSRSTSKSVSPVNAGEITYITSFGGEDNEPSVPSRAMSYADKVKAGPSKSSQSKRRSRSPDRRVRYRSRSRERKRNSSSSSRSRTRSRSRRHSRGSSPSNRRRFRRRSRSRSRSKSYKTNKIKRRSSSSSSNSTRSRSRSNVKTYRTSSSVSSSSRSRSRSLSSKRHFENKRSISPKPMDIDPPPLKTLPRYYGRRKSDKSSSELEDLSENDSESPKDSANKAPDRKLSGLVSTKAGAASKVNKADKKAQQLRTEKMEQEARERDDQMRELALKLRRRQRELKNYGDSSSLSNTDSEPENSKSEQDARPKSPSSNHSGSRSRRTPEKKDCDYSRSDDSSEKRARSYRDRDSDRYRDRDYDRAPSDYRRRRPSEDGRSSRSYHSSDQSKSKDSSKDDSRRYAKNSDYRKRESTSTSGKPLVDY